MNCIFLIEDDSDLSAGLLFTFAEEGYQTIHAATCREARKMFHQPFDLVVLDIMLPDGSGYDLCRELRTVTDVPIIFLTSCDDEVNIVMGLDGGGDDYVTKPFQLKVLMSRIKAHLRRREAVDAKALQAGNVRLDVRRGRAYVGQEELFLTATEYRLLLILVSHMGRILKRQQILDSLWDGKGEYIDDNTLSVHIRHLREKLTAAGSTASVGTVRGLGYRLEAKS
jgi:DNA-binding response OmpR family regulator